MSPHDKYSDMFSYPEDDTQFIQFWLPGLKNLLTRRLETEWH